MLRSFFLATVSLAGVSASVDAAIGQTANLPAVTVDAPTARPARRATVQRPSSARQAATTRRAPSRLQPVAPVAYVTPTTSTMSAPAVYAGGQVATGGQFGILGNRGIMDAPFSQVSYTEKLIKDQQARTIIDVLYNNPSIRTTWADNSYTSALMIRGFPVSPWDFGFNGLFGVVPGLTFTADSAERVEVLNGPSAFLNGLPPLGSVGGTINIVTKRATDDPITRLTGLYTSNSTFGTQIDVGRRYGEHKEWGVRFNGSYRSGNTSTDNQSSEIGNGALALDYRGERARMSLDVGYQTGSNVSPLRPTYVGAGVTAIPAAPNANANWFQPWTFANGHDFYGMWRGEVDINDDWTVFAAVGGRYNRDYILSGFANISNTNGNLTEAPFNFPVMRDGTSQEVGIRGRFETGPIKHQVSLTGTNLNDRAGSQSPTLVSIASNLYNPTYIAQPSYTELSPALLTKLHATTVAFSDTMSVFNDRVQLTVGGRQQQIDSENFSAATGLQTASYSKGVFTPAVGLVVKPLQNVSLYANYIEGLQAGVTVPVGYANFGTTLAPYVSKQVETGVKVDWSRIITTAAFFEINQPSLLIYPVTGSLGTYSQDGQQRNRGVELSAMGEVTESVRVLGGVTFLDGVLTRNANAALIGNKAPGVPDVQMNIGAEWDTPFLRGFTLNGRAIYTSAQYYDNANLLQIPDWVRFDIGARYAFTSPWTGKPITIRANVINVANKGYWAAATPTYGLVLGAPRTYMLSTTFDF